MNPLILNPMSVCEVSIASFLSSSLNSGSLSANIYTGIDNEDRVAPAVSVWCQSSSEVVFNSRNYEFDVNITVKDMAADDTISNFSTIAGNVLSYFTDSVSATAAINLYNTTNSFGIRFWQIRINGYGQETTGDTWVNNFNFKFIGALVPV